MLKLHLGRPECSSNVCQADPATPEGSRGFFRKETVELIIWVLHLLEVE